MAEETADTPRRRALDLLEVSRWTEATEQQARDLLPELRLQREFNLLAQVSERLIRRYPREPWLRRLQTQALIEIGLVSCAVEVARVALRKLPDSHPEWSELNGLIGRAQKQIAMDTLDATSDESLRAMRQSLAAYAKPFDKDAGNTWSAINLVAMQEYAKRVGTSIRSKIDTAALAQSITDAIESTPKSKQDEWSWATLAEAALALGRIDDVERYLKKFLAHPQVQAFHVASMLRQFSEIWGLKDTDDPRLRGLLQALRTRLLQLPGAMLNVAARDIDTLRLQSAPAATQLEAILGDYGTESFEWWKTGLDRARSVAAIHAGINRRMGTGFLVSAKDFGLGDANERLLLTNYHVVNQLGAGGALRPDDAQIAFEAIDAKKRYAVKELLRQFPVDQHDACLLRLEDLPPDVESMPLARNLPVIDDTAKVYVIGHPGGGELEFSFQDNALIDHEGAPIGKPPINGVCRLHYRAPTEKGSSGSPVFNAKYWQVIGLHHAGGDLSKLNGNPGTHLANEGVSLLSITEAVKSGLGIPPP